jgi:peptide methionine sulfoxide reductase msrA/msrB
MSSPRTRSSLLASLLASLAAPLTAGLFLLIACGVGESDPGADELPKVKEGSTVAVHVVDKTGKLVGPVQSARVVKDKSAWRKQLTNVQYEVARNAGTERAFSGTLLKNKSKGMYTCACCKLPLFSSKSKFKSGTGWPSFYEAIAKPNVGENRDTKFGWERVEIVCNRCDAHLGHVFKDGPKPTGLRYCVNSVAIQFTAKEKLMELAEPTNKKAITRAEVVFAGGCFWCVEAVFEELDGVTDAVSGYAGGSAETANYKAVCSGTSGHAEVVKIIYDPTKISYGELMRVHFATHNPTTLNRQGGDVGTQYRSAIFYANENEKSVAAEYIATLNKEEIFTSKVVTTLEPLKKFYDAENNHQNFVCDNPDQGYVRGVALPKVAKVRKEFPELLKKPKKEAQK